MNKSAKSMLRIGIAAIVGAIIGTFVNRGHLISAHSGITLLPQAMRISVALWVLFSIYWSIAAREQAPTKTGESPLSRQVHVVAVNAALIMLVFPVPGLTRRFLPDNTVLHAAGLLIQAAFIGLAVWARRHLGSNWSGEVRIATGHQLVRSGPYRLVRHPIYTAVVGMYVGTCLVSGQVHALVALALMMVAYVRKIRMEERALSETFPDDHEVYRRETWAWIPGFY